ncbi:hypothetical protein AXF42_Ash009922 [Apostasia shenzhenica]|uniref:Uncharacterized protein n=1 Tax=Apostasia shenzhenica TaxID=1088818 RepID=A0A2I0ACB9_9ASPA|nr:hypothetical protein AXF42_Ash009922 [Apostasia shenzhenica]
MTVEDGVVVAACESPEHVRQRQTDPQHVAPRGEETARKQGKPESESKKKANPRTHIHIPYCRQGDCGGSEDFCGDSDDNSVTRGMQGGKY